MPTLRIEELSDVECLDLLATVPVGRVGLTADGAPVILPVNFSVVDGAIVFRTVPGTKLAAAARESLVAFEADCYDADGRSGWSVLVHGVAVEVTESAELDRLLDSPGEAWGAGWRADHFIRIEPRRLTGRRFGQGRLVER